MVVTLLRGLFSIGHVTLALLLCTTAFFTKPASCLAERVTARCQAVLKAGDAAMMRRMVMPSR